MGREGEGGRKAEGNKVTLMDLTEKLTLGHRIEGDKGVRRDREEGGRMNS